ncbi:MAG: C25 family cysteine peptidase [candidate division WOR-3 bacterium]
MKFFKLSVILILTILAISLGRTPAKVTVQLHIPPQGQWQIENLWHVELNNQDGSTYHNVWLHGEIHHKEKKVLVYRANSNKLNLPPGKTTKRLQDIKLQDQWYRQGYEVFYLRSGTIPEGNYEYIVTLMPDLGGDTGQFVVRKPAPPRLLAPPDGAQLWGINPVVFDWTSVFPPQVIPIPQQKVKYTLRIVEILPGQTKEEALSTNQPWFEQTTINLTQLTYPTSAKSFEANKEYAWEVVAQVGSLTLTSEKRRFKRANIPQKPAELQCLTVERRVERKANYFKVFIDVKVLADVEDLTFQVWNTWFQCIPTSVAEGADIKATDYSGTRTRWQKNVGKKSKGANFTLEFHAVPILWSEESGWWWNEPYILCDSVVITYSRNGKNYVRRPDLSFYPHHEVNAALASADLIIVTCPKKLYWAYDDNEVHELLRWCGQVAWKMAGVLGYIEETTSGWQLKSMLNRGGFWDKLLSPAFRSYGGTWSGGYVFLVGEHNIVPSWLITGLNVKWSGDYVTTQVRFSDFPYSDCTGDWIVDLNVGRAIGSSAEELSQLVENTAKHPFNPARAGLVSGYDDDSDVLDNFQSATKEGASTLRWMGVQTRVEHIGVLPQGEKLPKMSSLCNVKNIVSFCGHGNVNVWGDVVAAWDVDLLPNSYSGCWFMAFSCLTGNYDDINAISRAFTKKQGVLGYIGSTEISAVAINHRLQCCWFWLMCNNHSWSPGKALFEMKYWYCPDGSKYERLAAYEYNLYGCPK